MAPSLEPFVPGALWVREYPVALAGARFASRMTVIRLRTEALLVHSPCDVDAALAAELGALGRVAAIIAPGNLHWLHVRSCQRAFPDAATYVCPGIETRAKDLAFDFVLGDDAPPLWSGELAQVALQGTRLVREVAFHHGESKTLILVDLVENFTPATTGTNWFARLAFRSVGMWNHPRPAPEYRIAPGDRARVRAGLERILAWDFERVILSHGDLITRDAKQVVAKAWQKLLR